MIHISVLSFYYFSSFYIQKRAKLYHNNNKKTYIKPNYISLLCYESNRFNHTVTNCIGLDWIGLKLCCRLNWMHSPKSALIEIYLKSAYWIS